MSQRQIIVGSGWIKLQVSTDLPDDFMRAAAAKAAAPFSGATGSAVVQVMRTGKGSVRDQFVAQTEERESGSQAWPKTKAFGTQPAPARTLHRTGTLQAAWEGMQGGTATRSDASVSIGVDESVVPYAGIFQRRTAARWRANPAHRSKGGKLRAQLKLGMTFGVWASEEHMLSGWGIPPRRVGAGKRMRAEVAATVITDVVALATGRPMPSKAVS